MHVEDNIKRLARLLMSVNVAQKKERPLTPIETAREIKQWMMEKNLSKEEISKKFRLEGTDMITQFLSLLTLPKEIQNAIEWGKSENGHLGFTAVSKLTALKNKQDMEKLAKSMIEHEFSKTEIAAIVNLKNRNSGKPIEECIEEIIRFKPKISKGYLLVSPLSKINLSKLEKLSNQKKSEPSEILKKIISKEIPEKLISNVKIREEGVTISLDEEGYNIFNSIYEKYHILLKDTVDFLIEKELK